MTLRIQQNCIILSANYYFNTGDPISTLKLDPLKMDLDMF